MNSFWNYWFFLNLIVDQRLHSYGAKNNIISIFSTKITLLWSKKFLCVKVGTHSIKEVRDNVYEALSVRFRQVSNEIKGMINGRIKWIGITMLFSINYIRLNNIADRNVLKSLQRKAVICQNLPEFYKNFWF